MIISRSPKDPLKRRTTGIYGHWPKFWRCSGHNFYAYKHPLGGDSAYETAVLEIAQEEEKLHEGHIIPHISYVGYLAYEGRKNRYRFWYMGNPYRHKVFEKISKEFDRLP